VGLPHVDPAHDRLGWNLRPLSVRDAHANNLAALLDFRRRNLRAPPINMRSDIVEIESPETGCRCRTDTSQRRNAAGL
jgi:hypothetical protein